MTTEPQVNLKQCVLARINRDGVCPRSRLFFQSCECFVWTLWLISVVIGALAVGVTVSVIATRRYALFEATHDTFLTFMVTVLPSVWLVAFAAMLVVGVLNVRHTRRGYRYALWQIAGSSIVISIAGGLLLHAVGLGYIVDAKLGQHMAMYMSQEKIEQGMWQMPEDGRLVARLAYSTSVPTSTLVLEDVHGARWVTDVSELATADLLLLQSGAVVRLLGKVTSDAEQRFAACGALPWLYQEEKVDMAALMEDRGSTRQRLTEHAAKRGAPLAIVATVTATSVPPPAALCAEHAAVRRLRQE